MRHHECDLWLISEWPWLTATEKDQSAESFLKRSLVNFTCSRHSPNVFGENLRSERTESLVETFRTVFVFQINCKKTRAKLNYRNSGNQSAAKRWYDTVITWLLKGQTIVSRYSKMSAWHHSFPSSSTNFSFVYKTVNDERQKLKLWRAINVLLY